MEIILLVLGIFIIKFIFKSAKFIVKIAVIGYLLFLLFKYKDIFLSGLNIEDFFKYITELKKY